MVRTWWKWLADDAEAGTSADTPDTDVAADDAGGQVDAGVADVPDSGGPAEGAAAATTAPPPGLRDYIRNTAGLDLGGKYKTDEEAARGIASAISMLGRRSEEAELGRQFAPYRNEFLRFLQQQAQQPPATPQPQQADPTGWWNPPKVDEAAQRWLFRDAEGNVQFRENTPLAIKEAIEKRQAYLQSWDERLHTNPVEALKPAFESFRDEIRQSILEEIGWQQSQQTESWQANSFVQANSNWLYQMTEDGRIVHDESGRRAFTPAGQYFTFQCQQLQGLGDQDKIIRTAYALTQLWAQQQNQAAAPSQAAATVTPAPPPPGVRSTRKPTSGTIPGQPKNDPGTKGRSFRDTLRAALADVPESEFQ